MKKFILFAFLLTIPLILSSIFLRADGVGVWTWDLQNQVIYNACIVVHPTNASILYAGANGSGVFLSIDGGITWVPSNSGLDPAVEALAISHSNPNVLYAGTATHGVYKSTDAGATWVQVNTGITESANDIQGIVIKPNDPNTVVVCIYKSGTEATTGVYKTTNGGTSWSGSNSGMTQLDCLSMVSSPNTVNTIYLGSTFSGAAGCHIYKSYNFGSSWIDVSNGVDTNLATGDDPFRALSIGTDTNVVLAARFWNTTTGGPWVTTNAGANWFQRANGFTIGSAPGGLLRSAAIMPGSSTEFFVGGDASNEQPGGVWRSTDAGMNWFSFNSGVMDSTKTVRALCFSMTPGLATLFAGVPAPSGTGVYDYGIPIGIKKIGSEVPKSFVLHQNYPNPFNPVTIISFDIPKNSNVKVEVYDLSGKLVGIIFSGDLKVGSYQYDFNASNLSSGVYFYRITAGNFVDTKKMMLVK